MAKKEFSATEVGTLLENMDKKFDLLAEIVAPMPLQLEKIEGRLENLELDVRVIKDVIRIEIPSMRHRISALEAKSAR